MNGPFVHARLCPRCQQQRTADTFTSTSAYCWGCRADYERQRRESIGTAARIIEPYRSAREPDPATETALAIAMAAFLRERGFTALRCALVRMENELARTKRAELAAEGWIA